MSSENLYGNKSYDNIMTYNDEFILIGVTGRKRSGKDTVGSYLIDNYGFIRVGFADALKEACKIIFGFTDEQVYGDGKGDYLKESIDSYWKHSPREILQKVGTELFRDKLSEVCEFINKDIWIRSVERTIMNYRKQGCNRIIITDVRFPNELKYVSGCNGTNWKVTRPSIMQDLKDTHASEIMIDDFKCDTEYINDGTIDDLYNKIDTKFAEILDNLEILREQKNKK